MSHGRNITLRHSSVKREDLLLMHWVESKKPYNNKYQHTSQTIKLIRQCLTSRYRSLPSGQHD
jgi:hypothetical protein